MLIRHFDGRRQEAMLLTAAGNVMRVAFPGADDCSELALLDGQWFTEDHRPVEIEFLAARPPAARFFDTRLAAALVA